MRSSNNYSSYRSMKVPWRDTVYQDNMMKFQIQLKRRSAKGLKSWRFLTLAFRASAINSVNLWPICDYPRDRVLRDKRRWGQYLSRNSASVRSDWRWEIHGRVCLLVVWKTARQQECVQRSARYAAMRPIRRIVFVSYAGIILRECMRSCSHYWP
jgi:hypothetical protein